MSEIPSQHTGLISAVDKKISSNRSNDVPDAETSRSKATFILLGLFTAGLAIALLAVVPSSEPAGMFAEDQESRMASLVYGEASSTGQSPRPLLSKLHPVKDMGLYSIPRSKESSPAKQIRRLSGENGAVPTHAWYQNMMYAPDHPAPIHRTYAIPYVFDAAGPIPGLQILPPHFEGTPITVQLSTEEHGGLTLGASHDEFGRRKSGWLTHGYSVSRTTKLGLTLEWEASEMRSSIVRGALFGTMVYSKNFEETTVYPSIATTDSLSSNPIADGRETLHCKHRGSTYVVNHELEIQTEQSGFTWLIFFSEPVHVQCLNNINPSGVIIQVRDIVNSVSDVDELIISAALLNNCTTGSNRYFCHEGRPAAADDIDRQRSILRKAVHFYPGPETKVDYHVNADDLGKVALSFDWDAQRFLPLHPRVTRPWVGDPTEYFMAYALPHHLDKFSSSDLAVPRWCTQTLFGDACLIKGSIWEIEEDLVDVGYRAPRAPKAEIIDELAQALVVDLEFRLPEHYFIGAGDTYFSGKMLARQARVMLIEEELSELCSSEPSDSEYIEACETAVLPSSEAVEDALTSLRDGISIWINGTAKSPFVYDKAWGGVLSCGCETNWDTLECRNVFPHCPAIEDRWLNFGNGMYNDHHFHYGYMIYAAAVVAHFDPSWAVENFESVLLLIRDIANPTSDDSSFPVFRHKDWYKGHSWASGIQKPPYYAGKNQESSSEAIAAYEAVALYGDSMVAALEGSGDEEKLVVAKEISLIGRLLVTTEIRSVDRYWHVRKNDPEKSVYPSYYRQNVIGVLWNTMAQFKVWFGDQIYLPYGVQLLPITPISEQRDALDWMREMYEPFADDCNLDDTCENTGWSVLQYAILASVGHDLLAAERAIKIPMEVYENPGGNGHSLSNLLWYIATRPPVEDPLRLPMTDKAMDAKQLEYLKKKHSLQLIDCDVPESCTAEVLQSLANSVPCGERIKWLITHIGRTESEACTEIAAIEYPAECGGCNPRITS